MLVSHKHGSFYFYVQLFTLLQQQISAYSEKRQLHLVPGRRGENGRKNKILVNLPDELSIKNFGTDLTNLNFKLTSQGVLVPNLDSARSKSLFIDLVKEAAKASDPESSSRSLSDNQKLISGENKVANEGDSSDNSNEQTRKEKEIDLKNEALAKIEELARQNLEDIAKLKNEALKEKNEMKNSKNETSNDAELKNNRKEDLNSEKEASGNNDSKTDKSVASDKDKYSSDTVVVEAVPEKSDDKTLFHAPDEIEQLENLTKPKNMSSKFNAPIEGKPDDGFSPKPVDVKVANAEKLPKPDSLHLDKQLEDAKVSAPDPEKPELPKEIVKQDSTEGQEGKVDLESKQAEEKVDPDKKKRKVKILILDDDESIPDHISNAEISHAKAIRPVLHVMGPNQVGVEEQTGSSHPVPINSVRPFSQAPAKPVIPDQSSLSTNPRPCIPLMATLQQHVVDRGPTQHIFNCQQDRPGIPGLQLPLIESKNPNGIPFLPTPRFNEEGDFYKPGIPDFNKYYPRVKHRHKLPRTPYEDKGLRPPEIHYHFHLSKDNFNNLKDKDEDDDYDDSDATIGPTVKDKLTRTQEGHKQDEQKPNMSPGLDQYLPMFKKVGDSIASQVHQQLASNSIEPTDIQIESNDIPRIQRLIGDDSRKIIKRTYKSKKKNTDFSRTFYRKSKKKKSHVKKELVKHLSHLQNLEERS